MSKLNKKYSINNDTLLYEERVEKKSIKYFKKATTILISTALAIVNFVLLTEVFDIELPKTQMLKKQSMSWVSKVEVLNKQLDKYYQIMRELEVKDDNIYRALYGLPEVSQEVRNAGFGGVDRYSFLDNGLVTDPFLKNSVLTLDKMLKKAYVASKSFDEVEACSKHAGSLINCIPAIPPITTNTFRVASVFGWRSDPLKGYRKMHQGFDFACPQGNKIYATGDGKVVSANYSHSGYGNCILIDHGYGYKTRYAHLKRINVREGMKIKRGTLIGESGNTGRSTGPHLHYEVIFRGTPVNPANYFDLSITTKDYKEMVSNN